MSMNIQSKQNYSFLFSNMGGAGSVSGGSNFLADYASIKNGSYGKLMKAYYSDDDNDSVKKIVNNSSSKDDTKTLSEIKSSSQELKESADALLAKGSKSVFNKVDVAVKDENGVETTTKDYDKDAIYNAVSSFVSDYNSVMKATDDANSSSVNNRTKLLSNSTAANSKLLSKIGITVNSDKTLTLDKDTFQKANMDTVQTLFHENGSYAYRVSSQASMIKNASENEASKVNVYNNYGAYANSFHSGNIFSSYF